MPYAASAAAAAAAAKAAKEAAPAFDDNGVAVGDSLDEIVKKAAGKTSKQSRPKSEPIVEEKFDVEAARDQMAEMEKAAGEGNERAALAVEIQKYQIKKYIGAYAAALNGVDIIVFTGGIGENDAYIRAEVIKGLTYLGIDFDESKNGVRGEEAILTTPQSKVTVCVIPTDEEWMIASDTMHLV